MPSIPELVYAALLYPDDNSPEEPSSKDFVKGVPNYDKFIFSFQRPDETDGITFTLEVFAFVKEDSVVEDGTSNFSRSSAPFSKAKKGLAIVGDAIVVNETIALEVNDFPGLTGTVSLKIKVPGGCTLEIDDTRFTPTQDENVSNAYTVTANGISASVYSVTFNVMKDEQIVYTFTENINVFPGICTDIWGGLAKDDAKEITQDMISSTVYVRGSDEEGLYWYAKNGYENIEGKDTNSGCFLAPFATIQKAVDAIIARNDGASEYTICVDGIVTQDTAPSGDGMADFAALDKNLNLTITTLSGTATLDANKKSRVINAKPTSGVLTLTMKNLIVKNGFTRNHGGGVFVKSPGGTLTMDACEISENNAETNGGGIYIGIGSEVTISGETKISGNIAKWNGGGLLSAGTFTMNGGRISDNQASSNGDGVCQYGTFNISGEAKIDGDNDVCLYENKPICVTGSLSAESPVATITLNDYESMEGKSILVACGDIEKITNDICEQFAVKPQDDGTSWKIVPSADGTGVLQKVGESTD